MVKVKRRSVVDHTVDCWACGRPAMKPKGSYYKCSKCGATWSETPAYDVLPLKVRGVFSKPWGVEKS